MKPKQKRNISKKYLILVVTLSIILGTGIAAADTIGISIAPATLNLNQIEDKFVTVHADIPYNDVNKTLTTLTLSYDGNSATADSIGVDDCGDLVVKFKRADVAGIVDVGKVTLTLTGEMNDGTPFTGSDTIRVIDPFD